MVRAAAKVLLADAVLLGAEFLILQDLQWRVTYASSVLRYTPSYTYSVLTQFFAMGGSTTPLRSPPTLDWVQLLVVVLVILNLTYAYRSLRRRSLSASSAVPTE